MASNRAVAAVLALLHELYPTRDLSDRTLDAWVAVFQEWSDEELHACALAATRDPGRAFFPTPGEIVAHRAPLILDVDSLLRRLYALGVTELPIRRRVFEPPQVDRVRDAYGDEVAAAYALAGPHRLWADTTRDGESTTRDIARRTFTMELRTGVQRNPALYALLTSPNRAAIAAGNTAALLERGS